MGEFSVKKFDTYILMQFPVNEWVGSAQIERVADLAHDLQIMNGGKTTIARIGGGFTMILDGIENRLDPEQLGKALV